MDAAINRYRKKEVQFKLLSKAERIGDERTVNEIDLENGGKGSSYNIGMLDSVQVRAGRSEFEIVFMGINNKGDLDCLIFENRSLKKEKSFAMDETEKIRSGMLMDGRLFTLTIIRLPFHNGEEGKVARVEMKIEMTDRPAIIF